MFQHECNKTGPLISSENEFEDFGLAAKTSLYMKRSIKKNSSKNWQRANNRGSPTTGCFWALTQAFPQSRTGRGQHIWYRQNLGSAVVLGQIKKNKFSTLSGIPLYTSFLCKKRHAALTRPFLTRERVANLSKNMLREVCPGRLWVAISDTLLVKGNVKLPVREEKQRQVAS